MDGSLTDFEDEKDKVEPIRKTVIIQGSLAYAMRRAAAARAGENGLQIMTVSQLAARLAGGFWHEATVEDIERSIRNALELGGFEEIERARHLPGMTRAIMRTLRKAWHADLGLGEWARSSDNARVRDLALVEKRVREQLPAGALLPNALRDAACTRAHVAVSSWVTSASKGCTLSSRYGTRSFIGSVLTGTLRGGHRPAPKLDGFRARS